MRDSDLTPIDWSHISGWADDDHLAAFEAFCVSARYMVSKPYPARGLEVSSQHLVAIAQKALAIGSVTSVKARSFFEENFEPMVLKGSIGEFCGFLTGYFEPEVDASRHQSAEFAEPLLRRPADLVDIDDTNRPKDMDPEMRFGWMVDGKLSPYLDRQAINEGALSGQDLEFVWLKNRVDAFFIHVQGSARLRLKEGGTMRVTYAAKSGHAYTSLAKIICQRHNIAPEAMTADRLRQWMEDNPNELDALLANNQSYIFFKEMEGLSDSDGPVGAAKVPLIEGRSVAVDRTLHTFGCPVWINTKAPLPGQGHPTRRLMMAHDTGSAIVGPARADYYVGSGFEAGEFAGKIRHQMDMVLLMPKAA